MGGTTAPATPRPPLTALAGQDVPAPQSTAPAKPDPFGFMKDMPADAQALYAGPKATYEQAQQRQQGAQPQQQPQGRPDFFSPIGQAALQQPQQGGAQALRNMPQILQSFREQGEAARGKTEGWQQSADRNRAGGNEQMATYFEDMIAREQAQDAGETAPAYKSAARFQSPRPYAIAPRLTRLKAVSSLR